MTKQDVPTDKAMLANMLQLSNNNLALLHQHSQSHDVKQNTVLVRKGDNVAGAYIVTRGSLRVFTYTAKGTETTLYFINPGETCVFALNCLFNHLLYPAWVKAEVDTSLSIISGSTYKELFAQEPAIQNLTIGALSTAVFRLMSEVEQIQGWTLQQRVANFLLERASDRGRVVITQQELAGHLGTSREVVARILVELAAQGLIATGRGIIQVLEPTLLSSLLRSGC